jgi:hypothetical protein
MTQTIKNCNEIPVGKTYPVSDLRRAESIEQLCEYVDAGHPISTSFGLPVFLLRRESDILFNCDVFRFGAITPMAIKPSELLKNIKLAPLAYRNGRPLHVGDVIEILYGTDESGKTIWGETPAFAGVESPEEYEWRFADEAETERKIFT